MPFNELQRRDSWPPTIVRVRDDEPEESDAIDENPFSFFLTSPEDIDDFLEDELSAGIETPDSSKPTVREVSPSSLQRALLMDSEDEHFGLAIPLSLKEFTQKHTSGRNSRIGHREDEQEHGLGIAIPKPSVRGRPKVRLAYTPRGGKGRGQTRSLSARRNQSWREPSPDIWSIEEERESDDEKQGRYEVADVQISASAPASTRIGVLATQSKTQKPKKRVHWAV
jgi:hypothetical protein